ncbi:MAG TPA: hypothetical protein VGO46_11180 [Gemmatimonadaceae bacterium]|nr:hypothetical protein [Gemmatimonadaceae bacterium]
MELPSTLRYAGVSLFPEDGPAPDNVWSVVLTFEVPPSEQAMPASNALVRFLFETAPHERLHAGRRFALYEGPTKVADIEVLD